MQVIIGGAPLCKMRSISEKEIRDCISNGHIIGQGASSDVYHGVIQGTDVAVKKIRNPANTRDCEILPRLQHDNIVNLYDWMETDKFTFIVMEYMKNCSLHAFLQSNGNGSPPTSQTVVGWMIQVAEGLEHMHSRNLIHRDIKPSNILLNAEENIVKIGDFGFARFGETEMTANKGTAFYKAPEQFEKLYTYKVDVYSFAMTLVVLLTGKEPYLKERSEGLTEFQIIQMIQSNELRPLLNDLPRDCSEQLKDLIRKCLDSNPDLRPNMEEVKKSLIVIYD